MLHAKRQTRKAVAVLYQYRSRCSTYSVASWRFGATAPAWALRACLRGLLPLYVGNGRGRCWLANEGLTPRVRRPQSFVNRKGAGARVAWCTHGSCMQRRELPGEVRRSRPRARGNRLPPAEEQGTWGRGANGNKSCVLWFATPPLRLARRSAALIGSPAPTAALGRRHCSSNSVGLRTAADCSRAAKSGKYRNLTCSSRRCPSASTDRCRRGCARGRAPPSSAAPGRRA